MEYRAKDTAIDSARELARELTGQLSKENEIKLWAKFINHQLAAWAALFELTTGNKPPKIKEILAVISGH